VFDMDRILNAFLEHIRSEYADDVALVLTCGSRFRGDHHPKSDLDVIFINDTPRGAEASVQFVIGDIGFDFYPWSWDRAENVASFGQPILANILDAKVVHARSEADLERLASIRGKARWLMSPEGRSTLLSKAAERFKECCTSLCNIRIAAKQDDLASVKIEAGKLSEDIVFVTLMMNQTYSQKGWIRDYPLIEELPIRAKGLTDCISVIMDCPDTGKVLEASERLADETRTLLLEETRKAAPAGTYAETFPGLYEEFKAIVNKIDRACDTGNSEIAFFSCLSWQDEFARFLERAETGVNCSRLFTFSDCRKVYDEVGLPDFGEMVSDFDPEAVKKAIRSFDEKIKRRVESKGVTLNVFENEEEFEGFLRKR
jgi:predicted nucleotidyltransferase